MKQVNIKIVLLGTGNTGKTTFMRNVAYNESVNSYSPTVGVSHNVCSTHMLGNSSDISLFIVDTSETVSLNNGYVASLLNRCNICLIFFDATNRESIARSQTIYNFANNMVSGNNLSVPLYESYNYIVMCISWEARMIQN